MIDTTDEFRAYMENLGAQIKANPLDLHLQELYLSAMQNLPAFISLKEALDALAGSADDATTSVQDFIESIKPEELKQSDALKEVTDWFADLGMKVPATSDALYELIQAGAFTDAQLQILANHADLLATVWGYIADKMDEVRGKLIEALEETYNNAVEAENKRYDDLVESLRDAEEAAKDARREAYDAKVDKINDEIEKLTDAISAFKTAFESSTKALRSLLELTDKPDQTRQRYIEEAKIAIESLKKGIAPDNLEDIISGLSSVDQNDFATRENWEAAIAENKAILETINSLTGDKTDSMQTQLDLLNEQLKTEKELFDAAEAAADKRLDAALEAAEDQHKDILEELKTDFDRNKKAIEDASLDQLIELTRQNGTLADILAVLEAIRAGSTTPTDTVDKSADIVNNMDPVDKAK
jgi:hypothetical protein